MLRIKLTAGEQAVGEHTFKPATDRRLRERCQAVLMAQRGRKRQASAAEVGVRRTTVKKWLDQYRAQGVEGWKGRRATGKPQRIPEALAPTLVEGVKGGPQRCGLNRAHWTDEELAVQGYRLAGMSLKRTALRAFCPRHQIRPYRPTYRYLRGDSQRRAATKAELGEMKKSPGGGGHFVEPG
jgi:transposase